MLEIETKRLFIAIFPPARVVANLQAVAADLAGEIPARAMRWTRPEQIHLTLHFLGAIEIARLPEIESALAAACKRHRSHKVRATGLGCFPDQARPQILWAGLGGDLPLLEGLKKSIDAGLLACGCLGEDRPFHPHLTLGRVTALNPAGRKQLVEALVREALHDFGEWQVERVDLMESVLSRQGAVYSTLQSVVLENVCHK